MADDRMSLLETMRKAGAEGDTDFLRQGVQVLAEAVMEAEVTELTGVAHGVRDPEHRVTQRNGYRERRWDTRVGTIGLAIPRVRDGSYFPSLLEPRRRAERACSRSCRKPTSWGSARVAWKISSRPSASAASAAAGSAVSVPRSMPRSRPSATVPWRARPVPTSGWTPRASRCAMAAAS